MKLTKENMPETMYRASRCCRVLGNPTAYLVLRCLDRSRKTPHELSQELAVSLTTVSMTLRHLREVDLVRYVTEGRTKQYWLKSTEVRRILDTLEQWVEKTRHDRE